MAYAFIRGGPCDGAKVQAWQPPVKLLRVAELEDHKWAGHDFPVVADKFGLIRREEDHSLVRHLYTLADDGHYSYQGIVGLD